MAVEEVVAIVVGWLVVRCLWYWRPGDLATWQPASDLLATSAGDLATWGSSPGKALGAHTHTTRGGGHA
eukprot:6297497-Prymnesium_polylepis.1